MKLHFVFSDIFAIFKQIQINKLLFVRRWVGGKESACQCRRHGFNPWVKKIFLEKEMAAYSSILAWESLWTKEPSGLQSMRSQKSQTCLAIKQQQQIVKDTRLLKIAWTLRTKETGISLAVVKTPCFQHSRCGINS